LACAWAIAFTCNRLAAITRATNARSTHTTAIALPLASRTTSSFAMLLLNPSSPARVMSTRHIGLPTLHASRTIPEDRGSPPSPQHPQHHAGDQPGEINRGTEVVYTSRKEPAINRPVRRYPPGAERGRVGAASPLHDLETIAPFRDDLTLMLSAAAA
jgi:hypothetical protein